jgi:hypothetical protein
MPSDDLDARAYLRRRPPPPAWPFVLLFTAPTAYMLGHVWGWWGWFPFLSF